MINKNHDVMMICKGLYDSDKYESDIEALRGYYRREYCPMDNNISNMTIIKVLLLPVAQDYLRQWVLCDIILSLFSTQYTRVDGFACPVGDQDRAERYVLRRLISEISMLSVRDSNGDYLIDVSEYDDFVV